VTEPPEPQPNVRRAYRSLLGNAYEQFFTTHMQLSALAMTLAPDFDRAWEWQRTAVAGAAETMPPFTYQPALITNQASALVPFERLNGTGIAEFVASVEATFLVVSYATSSGRSSEEFTLYGTDGFSARKAQWIV
jgi:hypothetical protein